MIGLIAHSSKADAREVLQEVVSALDASKTKYLLETETASLLGISSSLSEPQLAKRCHILVVMGGDGTILHVVHRLGSHLCPIFGLNIGSLGFLTCAGSKELPRAVESLIHRDYVLSRRSLMFADLTSEGKRQRFHALNDIVISRGERSELVKIEIAIDGAPFTGYNADGLIIASPTGSTAYSLSAGGPILMPESGCHVITPICPHVLTNRSTVVSDTSSIEARLTQEGKAIFLTADGQECAAMRAGDHLKIGRSRRILPLAMLPERPFPELLRQKLKWSGSNI